jgi:hypothetical protein
MVSPAFQIILSLLPLFFGRRLFWLFVGVVGFLVGVALSGTFFEGLNDGLQLLLALGMGVLFALLAVAIQRPMAMLAGFFALGSIGLLLAQELGLPGNRTLLLALVVGIIGAILVALTFDWALIILSAFNGAGGVSVGLLALAPELPGWAGLLITLVLTAIGITFQARDLAQGRSIQRARRR